MVFPFLAAALFALAADRVLAAPPIAFHVHDSYFVVAHFHYVLSCRAGVLVTVDDHWGHGNSLEWATSSPPPLRNFDKVPRIRSERPAFDAKLPELAAGEQSPAGPPEGWRPPLDRRVRRRCDVP